MLALEELNDMIINREQRIILREVLHKAYEIRRPRGVHYQYREQVIEDFIAISRKLYGFTEKFSTPDIVPYGSFVMDLFTTESDLDMSINFNNNATEISREKKFDTLKWFADHLFALQTKGQIRDVQPIYNARVPIIKFSVVAYDLDCDLSVGNMDGISMSMIIMCVNAIDVRFTQLCYLMKAWAKGHAINSSRDRTLSSISIVLLVAVHLQTRDPPILPPFSAILEDGKDFAAVKKSVGRFQEFGLYNFEPLEKLLASVEKIWPKGLCASPYKGCLICKPWGRHGRHIASMSIEDFTDPSQNVARAVDKSGVKIIYERIHLALQNLRSYMNGNINQLEIEKRLFGMQ